MPPDVATTELLLRAERCRSAPSPRCVIPGRPALFRAPETGADGSSSVEHRRHRTAPSPRSWKRERARTTPSPTDIARAGLGKAQRSAGRQRPAPLPASPQTRSIRSQRRIQSGARLVGSSDSLRSIPANSSPRWGLAGSKPTTPNILGCSHDVPQSGKPTTLMASWRRNVLDREQRSAASRQELRHRLRVPGLHLAPGAPRALEKRRTAARLSRHRSRAAAAGRGWRLGRGPGDRH